MENCFTIHLSADALGKMSSLALAHIGDGVFELLVRTDLCQSGLTTAAKLHSETVRRVSAPAQAAALERILPLLSDTETAVFKRGRNAHVHAVPKNATRGDYAKATGLEALFGYLYLSGETDRISELFTHIREGYQHAV